MPTAVLVSVKRVTAMVEDLSVQMVGAASRTASLSAEALLVLALVARLAAGECQSNCPKKDADLVSLQGVVAATLTVLLEIARMVIVLDLEHRRRHPQLRRVARALMDLADMTTRTPVEVPRTDLVARRPVTVVPISTIVWTF